jgi:hypothetical protein
MHSTNVAWLWLLPIALHLTDSLQIKPSLRLATCQRISTLLPQKPFKPTGHGWMNTKQ